MRSFSCCSPIASIRFKLLFPVSVRFSCCPPIASLQLLLATCVRSSYSCPISTAPRLRPLRLLLPDCVRFNCSSPIASACSLTCSGRFQPMPNVLESSSQSSRFSTLKYEGRASLVYSRPTNIPLPSHTHTCTLNLKLFQMYLEYICKSALHNWITRSQAIILGSRLD